MTEGKRRRGRPNLFEEKMTVMRFTRLTPTQDKLFQALVDSDPRYTGLPEAIRGLILDAIQKRALP